MVGTGGFEPHGSMMPVHDAEADRRVRQREISNVGRYFLGLLVVCAAMLGLLFLLSLAAGIL